VSAAADASLRRLEVDADKQVNDAPCPPSTGHGASITLHLEPALRHCPQAAVLRRLRWRAQSGKATMSPAKFAPNVRSYGEAHSPGCAARCPAAPTETKKGGGARPLAHRRAARLRRPAPSDVLMMRRVRRLLATAPQ
jgi:hypothetical protein